MQWLSLVLLPGAATGATVTIRTTDKHRHVGQWSYTEPEQPQRYGLYLYSSPMGRTCERTFTLYIPPTFACGSRYVFGEGEDNYFDSLKCIPDWNEQLAYYVDRFNAKDQETFLTKTCLQLASSHMDFYNEDPYAMAGALYDAAYNWPVALHAVTSHQPWDRLVSLGRAASFLGLPLIDSYQGGGQAVLPDNPPDETISTLYRTKSDAAFALPGIMEMLPQRFAVLMDSETASSMGAALATLLEEKASAGDPREMAVSQIVPAWTVRDPLGSERPVAKFLDDVVRSGARYILLATVPAENFAVLACMMYKKDLHEHLRVIAIGHPTYAHANMVATSCALDGDVVAPAVMHATGWSGVWPSFTTPGGGDFTVNRAAAAQNITVGRRQANGSLDETAVNDNFEPWVPAYAFNETGVPEGCGDNDDAVNENVVIRRLLGVAEGETLACSDLGVGNLGQAHHTPFFQQVAHLCPVSVCKYNPISFACRVSCACTEQEGLVLPAGRGSTLCLEVKDVPKYTSSFGLPEFNRCEGMSCRELTLAGAGQTVSRLLQDWRSYIFEGWCANYTCSPVMTQIMTPLDIIDGLVSAVEMFRCIERNQGVTGLARVEAFGYSDDVVVGWFRACLEKEVVFQGLSGVVDFKFRRSPSPGFAVSVVSQTDYVRGAAGVVAGVFTADGVILANYTTYRGDYTACTPFVGEIGPGRVCPEDSEQQFTTGDTEQDFEAVFNGVIMARAKPETCGGGQEPIATINQLMIVRGGSNTTTLREAGTCSNALDECLTLYQQGMQQGNPVSVVCADMGVEMAALCAGICSSDCPTPLVSTPCMDMAIIPSDKLPKAMSQHSANSCPDLWTLAGGDPSGVCRGLGADVGAACPVSCRQCCGDLAVVPQTMLPAEYQDLGGLSCDGAVRKGTETLGSRTAACMVLKLPCRATCEACGEPLMDPVIPAADATCADDPRDPIPEAELSPEMIGMSVTSCAAAVAVAAARDLPIAAACGLVGDKAKELCPVTCEVCPTTDTAACTDQVDQCTEEYSAGLRSGMTRAMICARMSKELRQQCGRICSMQCDPPVVADACNDVAFIPDDKLPAAMAARNINSCFALWALAGENDASLVCMELGVEVEVLCPRTCGTCCADYPALPAALLPAEYQMLGGGSCDNALSLAMASGLTKAIACGLLGPLCRRSCEKCDAIGKMPEPEQGPCEDLDPIPSDQLPAVMQGQGATSCAMLAAGAQAQGVTPEQACSMGGDEVINVCKMTCGICPKPCADDTRDPIPDEELSQMMIDRGVTSCAAAPVVAQQLNVGILTACGAVGPEASILCPVTCSACPKVGGFTRPIGLDACTDCAPGTFSPGGTASCRKCGLGFFQNETGQSKCNQCLPGTYSEPHPFDVAYVDGGSVLTLKPIGSTRCLPCAGEDGSKVGLFSSFAAARCVPCPAGTARVGPDPTTEFECMPCPRGTYRPGDRELGCISCNVSEHKTTIEQGAGSKDACVCDVGYVRRDDDTHDDGFVCDACPVGSKCDSPGLIVPGQPEGYYVMNRTVGGEIQWTVFRCSVDMSFACNETADPRSGRCLLNRDEDTLACSMCLEDHYQYKAECKQCNPGTRALPAVIFIVGYFGAMLGVYYFCNSAVTKSAAPLLSTSVSFGLMLTALQSLSILGQLSVQWESPWYDIMMIVKLFAFDLEFVQLECIALRMPALTRYLYRALIPMITIIIYLSLYCVSKVLCPLFKKTQWQLPGTCNSIGTIWQSMYITISLIALLPFQCYDHPNGDSSISKFPEVICGGDEYGPFLGLGIFTTALYGVGFFALTMYANIIAPVASAKRPKFTLYFRFLFFRFRMDRWYWGQVLFIRSFAIALVPIIGVGRGTLQVVMLTVIAGFFLVLQCVNMPWKTPLLNYSDTAILAMVILIAAGSSVFSEQEASTGGYTGFVMFCFGSGLFVIMCILFNAMHTVCQQAKGKNKNTKAAAQFGELAKSMGYLLQKLVQLRDNEIVIMLEELGDFDKLTVERFMSMMNHELSLSMSNSKRMSGSKRLSVSGSKTSLAGARINSMAR